jgi:hypothetical protein
VGAQVEGLTLEGLHLQILRYRLVWLVWLI